MSRHAWQGPCPLTKVNSPEAIESSVTSNYPIKPLRSSNSFSMAFLFFFFPPQSLDRRNYRDRCVSSKSIQRNIISIQRQLSPFYRGEMDLFDSALIDSREKICNAILKPIRYRTFLHLARDFSPSLCSFSPFSLPEKGQNRFKASLFL